MILQLLVALILLGLLFWAVRAIAAAFGIPPPIMTVIQVLLVMVTVLWILQIVGLLPSALRWG